MTFSSLTQRIDISSLRERCGVVMTDQQRAESEARVIAFNLRRKTWKLTCRAGAITAMDMRNGRSVFEVFPGKDMTVQVIGIRDSYQDILSKAGVLLWLKSWQKGAGK